MQTSFTRRAGAPNTMLIVDDDELNRDILSMIFEADHAILQAENGLQGPHSGAVFHRPVYTIHNAASFLKGPVGRLNGFLWGMRRTGRFFRDRWVRFATQAPDFSPVFRSMCPSFTEGGTHQPPTIYKFLLFA